MEKPLVMAEHRVTNHPSWHRAGVSLHVEFSVLKLEIADKMKWSPYNAPHKNYYISRILFLKLSGKKLLFVIFFIKSVLMQYFLLFKKLFLFFLCFTRQKVRKNFNIKLILN